MVSTINGASKSTNGLLTANIQEMVTIVMSYAIGNGDQVYH